MWSWIIPIVLFGIGFLTDQSTCAEQFECYPSGLKDTVDCTISDPVTKEKLKYSICTEGKSGVQCPTSNTKAVFACHSFSTWDPRVNYRCVKCVLYGHECREDTDCCTGLYKDKPSGYHESTQPFCDKKPRDKYGVCKACIRATGSCSKLPCCDKLRHPTSGLGQCLRVGTSFAATLAVRRCSPDRCNAPEMAAYGLYQPACKRKPTPDKYKGAVFCSCPFKTKRGVVVGYKCTVKNKACGVRECLSCLLDGTKCTNVKQCCDYHTCSGPAGNKVCKRPTNCQLPGESCKNGEKCCDKRHSCIDNHCSPYPCKKSGEYCSYDPECCKGLSCKANSDAIKKCA